MTRLLKSRVLLVSAVALSLYSAPAAYACSGGRPSSSDMRAAQARALGESDLVFLARVIGYGSPTEPDDTDITIIFYEPIELVSGGDLPTSLSVSVLDICNVLPPVGETLVILMRDADLSDANRSGTAGWTSTIVGSYGITNIPHPVLRRRVDQALERANIE